jgi:hypothetical protein
MPEFTIVPMREAQVSTVAGRQGRLMQEYIHYIRQIPHGQAGKLHLGEHENPVTIRRLVQAAQAIDTKLIIKRSGQDMYFWKESGEAEQPRSKRRYTKRSRRGRAGDFIVPNQSFNVPEEGEQGVTEEESPELGQT